MKKSRLLGAALVAALWLGLSLFTWVKPADAISDSERRPLAQFPEWNMEFMSKFEDYTLDQFPLRDGFRKLKAGFHYYLLGQQDNNGIVLQDGHAAKLEMTLNEISLQNALKKFQSIYDAHLQDSTVHAVVVPDKGYYLEDYPTMDYNRFYTLVREGMPYATHVDLRHTLTLDDYYRTDAHWRQENLLDAAGVICEALGVAAPNGEDYRVTALERPFYGVYYGQAALPMEADTLRLMESELLAQCVVTNYETGKTGTVYDMSKLDSKDLYDVFLSGAVALQVIENPNASTDRELIIFRDSFGSSMIPLLVGDFSKVTVIDIRYVSSAFLGQLVDFHGQDVLFLYSTMVLNNSSTLK